MKNVLIYYFYFYKINISAIKLPYPNMTQQSTRYISHDMRHADEDHGYIPCQL